MKHREEEQTGIQAVSPSASVTLRARQLLLVVCLVCAIVFLIYVVERTPISTQGTPGDIVIGFNADMSSSGTGPAGISARQGFEIAIDEVNAAGGVLGKNVRGVIYDDQLDKERSKKNVIRLINEDHAVAIIGPANSGNALHWIGIAQESRVTVISPIASNSEITQRFKDRARNYIFRVAPTDLNEIRVVVPYLLVHTPNERIAILYDTTAYGLGGQKDTINVLARWGVVPVFMAAFDRGASTSSIVRILEEARAVGVEGIVIYALSDSTTDVLNALTFVPDYQPLLVGPYANVIPSLWELAGPLAEGIMFGTSASVNADHSPAAQRLAERIVLKYGTSTPSFTFAAQGYDATKMLLQAISESQTTDRTAIRDALEAISRVDGVAKTYVHPFSSDNHEAFTVSDIILAHWVDGTVVRYDEPTLTDLNSR